MSDEKLMEYPISETLVELYRRARRSGVPRDRLLWIISKDAYYALKVESLTTALLDNYTVPDRNAIMGIPFEIVVGDNVTTNVRLVVTSPEECQGWRAHLPALGKDET